MSVTPNSPTWPVRILDVHSHWGTRRGYRLRTAQELAQQSKVWRSEPSYVSESEMAEHFRLHRVRVILDLGFTKNMPISQARDFHDYALEVQKAHSDVIFGNWLNIDLRQGDLALAEIERCRSLSAGFVGLVISGASLGIPASDPACSEFFELCEDKEIPVLILTGFTGSGAGLPAGSGVLLDHCHPRHVDFVAAKYPKLRIIAGRPAWPWQDEMIAILLHKRDVYYELHGWSPKYHSESLKSEIRRRLAERVMFGADYPLLGYERLVSDWIAEGYTTEVLAGIFYRNAETYFGINEES